MNQDVLEVITLLQTKALELEIESGKAIEQMLYSRVVKLETLRDILLSTIVGIQQIGVLYE